MNTSREKRVARACVENTPTPFLNSYSIQVHKLHPRGQRAEIKPVIISRPDHHTGGYITHRSDAMEH